MKYALGILRRHLRNERQAREQAREWLRGSGIDGLNKDDVNAFQESLDLANKRIPDLEAAIDFLIIKLK